MRERNCEPQASMEPNPLSAKLDLVDGGHVIAGSPETVRQRMEELIKGLHVGNIFCLMHVGDMPKEKAMYSTKLFAEKVMPKLRHLHPEFSDDDRFWCKPGPWGNTTGESYADTGYQEAWAVTAGQPGVTGILNNYTGGDVSRQLSPARPFSDTGDQSPPVAQLVRDAASGFLRQIEPVHPGLTAKYTGKAQLSAWYVNPNSLGSYSFWTPGYCERFCTVERVPARPIQATTRRSFSSKVRPARSRWMAPACRAATREKTSSRASGPPISWTSWRTIVASCP